MSPDYGDFDRESEEEWFAEYTEREEKKAADEEEARKRRPLFVPLSSVERKPVSWLWRGYVPAGRLTIEEGDPGLLKSTLALDLCARWSTGRPMPDGSPGVAPMNVLFISAEDAADDTIRPRYEAAGGDVDRAFVLNMHSEELLSFPEDADKLAKFIADNKVGAAVLDPLNAFLSDEVRTNTDHSVRRALAPLTRLAMRTGAALLVIRHLRKARGGPALMAGLGSIGFTGAMRSVLLVGRDKDDTELRVIGTNKSSLGPPMPTLGFRPRSVPELDTVAIDWVGQVSVSVDELIAETIGDVDERRELGDLVWEVVADAGGQIDAKDAMRQLRGQGYSDSAIHRARRRARIASKKDGFGTGAKWVWVLPASDPVGDPVPPTEDAVTAGDTEDVEDTEHLTMDRSAPSASSAASSEVHGKPSTCMADGCESVEKLIYVGGDLLCLTHQIERQAQP